MKSIMKQGDISYLQSINIHDIDHSIRELLSNYPVDQIVADKVTILLQTKDELSITLGCELVKQYYPNLNYFIDSNTWTWKVFAQTGIIVLDPSRTANIIQIAIK